MMFATFLLATGALSALTAVIVMTIVGARSQQRRDLMRYGSTVGFWEMVGQIWGWRNVR